MEETQYENDRATTIDPNGVDGGTGIDPEGSANDAVCNNNQEDDRDGT